MYNKVYVEITNICNMNCSFCHGHKRATDIVEGFKCDKAAEDLCKRCCYAQRFVK